MSSPTAQPPRFRPLNVLPLVVSVVCAGLIAQMAWKDPRYLLPCAAILAVSILPRYLAKWRTRKLLLSGDVERVLGSWKGTVDRVAYPETMQPLMAATAYASYGWIEAARRALTRAVKGPAWEAAVEQRLFVEALLDTFEGENVAAAEKAAALEALPIPPVGWFGRKRVTLLRRALTALVRAFSHASRLRRAASQSGGVVAARALGAVLRGGDRGRRQGGREASGGTAGGRARVAGGQRISLVSRRAEGADGGVTALGGEGGGAAVGRAHT
jgi:hypothetical protein